MQLRLQPRTNRSLIRNKLAIKIILFALIFLLAIFLLDKIEIATPNKLIKQEISNDKLITLKYIKRNYNLFYNNNFKLCLCG